MAFILKMWEMRGARVDIPPSQDSLDLKVRLPTSLADRARTEIRESIEEKRGRRPRPKFVEPPTIFTIAPLDIPIRSVTVSQILNGYGHWAEEEARSTDDVDTSNFLLDLAQDISRDLADESEEMHTPPHLPSRQSVDSPTIVTTESHNTHTPETRGSPPATEEVPKLPPTSTIPQSANNFSPIQYPASTETSESDMDDTADMDENDLYKRVRLLHGEARQKSLRLHQLHMMRSNIDWNLDEQEQRVLNKYRVQLAKATPSPDNTISIDRAVGFEVEKIFSRKRDMFGSLLEEIQALERELFGVESRQRLVEKQLHLLYAGMHGLVANPNARTQNESEMDDESEASELEIFDPEDHHPLYNEWQERDARLKNLQEKLWAFQEDEARLADQKELREKGGAHLAKEDEEELAALPARIDALRAKFQRDGEEANRLKGECLKLRIIDENGRPRESTNPDTEAGERMKESEHSEASDEELNKYDEWQEQVARMKNKQEKLWAFQNQKARLKEGDEDSEGESYGTPRDEEQLKTLTEQVERLEMELEEGLMLQDRLRDECLDEGLIDEQENRIVGARSVREERTSNHLGGNKLPTPAPGQQQRMEVVVSPPPASDKKSITAYELQSANTFLKPPAADNRQLSRGSEYPLFASSENRYAPMLLSRSDPLSIDAWLFDQLIDSGGERRLLATILQAKGASNYEDLEKAGRKVVYYWNSDPSEENIGLPPPPYKDLRESVSLIKREGYDNLLVKQVVGYAMEENCGPEWEKDFELSDEDEDDLPDY